MTESAKNGQNRQVPTKERASYGMYFLGQNIFYILLYMYLNTYFTDIGISTAAVAGVMMAVKIWDAINDPIFGGLVDRIRFRRGKFIPWLRVSLVFIPLATILLFAIPSSIGIGAKIAWAAVAYILWDTAYTICDVPIFGLVTTMTNDSQERVLLNSLGRIAALVAAIAVVVVVPMFRQVLGGWLMVAVVLSVLAVATMLPICIMGKERVEPQQEEQKIGLKTMLKYVVSNKYLLIFYSSYIVINTFNVIQVWTIYIARHCFFKEEFATYLSLVTIVPTIIAGLFVPMIAKKIDKFKLYLWANIALIFVPLVRYLVGYENVALYIVFAVICAIPLGFTSVLAYMFTPDCAEYGHFRSGTACPGIAFSLQTFFVKMQTALTVALAAFALSLIGFVEGENAIQPAQFADDLWMLVCLLPAIGAVIGTGILFLYRLCDHDVQLMTKANLGEISKEEAQQGFLKKF